VGQEPLLSCGCNNSKYYVVVLRGVVLRGVVLRGMGVVWCCAWCGVARGVVCGRCCVVWSCVGWWCACAAWYSVASGGGVHRRCMSRGYKALHVSHEKCYGYKGLSVSWNWLFLGLCKIYNKFYCSCDVWTLTFHETKPYNSIS
jgi:hypothetical protein